MLNKLKIQLFFLIILGACGQREESKRSEKNIFERFEVTLTQNKVTGNDMDLIYEGDRELALSPGVYGNIHFGVFPYPEHSVLEASCGEVNLIHASYDVLVELDKMEHCVPKFTIRHRNLPEEEVVYLTEKLKKFDTGNLSLEKFEREDEKYWYQLEIYNSSRKKNPSSQDQRDYDY